MRHQEIIKALIIMVISHSLTVILPTLKGMVHFLFLGSGEEEEEEWKKEDIMVTDISGVKVIIL